MEDAIANDLDALKLKLNNDNLSCTHVLIIDDAGGPTVNKRTIYSKYIMNELVSGHMRLFIISSEQGLDDEDKKWCTNYAEIDDPNKNALVEIHASKFHENYRIDLVYTKQEDLILRAAHLRRLFGCKHGLMPENALAYRDKEAMNVRARDGGFPVPFFSRVRTPADILGFTRKHGFPIIVKPTLGSCSTGIRVIHDNAECVKYLINEFYANGEINDNEGLHDHAGNQLVQVFVSTKMYHVNGYARNGTIMYAWPFQYLNTNLGFTRGNAYGNVFINKTDSKWQGLVDAAQKICDSMPKTKDLFFHIELFEKVPQLMHNPTAPFEYALCEIAARRPGGSIGLLMDAVEGGTGTFPENEFRLNIGLDPVKPISESARIQSASKVSPQNDCVGDLMVPLQKGILVSVPNPDQLPSSNVQYRQIAKVGTVYRGFDVLSMNTCARFSVSNMPSPAQAEAELIKCLDWFNSNISYQPLDGCEAVDSAPNKTMTH